VLHPQPCTVHYLKAVPWIVQDPAVAWLLSSPEPAVRFLTRRDVLGDPSSTCPNFAHGPIASALLHDPTTSVYAKWRGPFWRITALTELGVPPDQPDAHHLLDSVLEWLRDMETRRRYPPIITGQARAHACWHGNALVAAVQLLRLDDAAPLVDRLVAWQWPDGGWNCDRRPVVPTSSVHESFGALWGLAGYADAAGDSPARQAADRAAEFFLARLLFRHRSTGQVIDPKWLQFRHPTYYHYDILQGLWILARAGYLADPRVEDAIAVVRSARRSDGRWNANGRWGLRKLRGASGSNAEAADWGPSRPSTFVTLKALTILAQRTAE
jgi:hypothetical protein